VSGLQRIGSKLAMDADKVIADAKLTIRQGAVIPWQGHFTGKGKLNGSWTAEQLRAMEEQWGVDLTNHGTGCPNGKKT
jgi:excinuclease ABC subunit A